MKTTKSCLAYAINICKKWVDPVQHFGNSEWKKEMGILLLDDNLKPRKFKNFLTLLKNQQSKQNPVRTLIEKTVTCIKMMSFIYNWGHSWWPVGCCIPADVCGLEYRMPACTMSQRFLHQLPALKWEEISHTHTHTHTHAYIFLLSLEKKRDLWTMRPYSHLATTCWCGVRARTFPLRFIFHWANSFWFSA